MGSVCRTSVRMGLSVGSQSVWGLSVGGQSGWGLSVGGQWEWGLFFFFFFLNALFILARRQRCRWFTSSANITTYFQLVDKSTIKR